MFYSKMHAASDEKRPSVKNKTFCPIRAANVSLSPAADYDVMGAAAAVCEPPHFRAGLPRNKELLSAGRLRK
ncbi:hypothetical protein M8494_02755 [Serratia ureilytica]